ncbi:Uncharacterised protein [uncultured Ruminococcus sp.]|nr:Uncharacterised protein [uncultured Ruminococcus sp.]
MMLALVAASVLKIYRSCKINPRAVLLFQLQPNLPPLSRRMARLLIHPLLKFVYQATIGDKRNRLFQLENLELLQLLFKKETVPWARQQLHTHGVGLAAFHCRTDVLHNLHIPRKVIGKGMACFMGDDIDILHSAVEI